MKRANETSSTSSHASAFSSVKSSGRTSPPDASSTTSAETNTAVQPSMTSTSDRTGSAILPTAPSAVSLRMPANDPENRNVFEDRTLVQAVRSKVSKSHFKWKDTELSLKALERKDFLIVSLYEIASQHGTNGLWSGIVDRIMDAVGMEAMLAQKWPANKSLLHILAALKNHTWLQLALGAPNGRLSLQICDALGRTPLHIAVSHGTKKVVQAILAFDDDAGSLRLQKTKQKKHIPLHIACAHGHDAIVALLLKIKGQEQRLTAGKHNLLPIHAAVTCGAGTGVLQLLLAECAAEQVCALTSSGTNALMFAVSAQLPKSVKMLLEVPGTLAGQLGVRDENGHNAIDCARDTGNAEVIALLEAAMRHLPAETSSTADTASASTTTAIHLQPAAGTEPPVPLTPNQPTPAPAVQPNFSDTEEDDSSV